MTYKVITIDGPAGSGKSTVSRLVAKRLGFIYLDTGAMYRAVALQAKRSGIGLHDGQALEKMCSSMDLKFISDGDDPRIFLGNEDISLKIREPEMDMLSSSISVVKEVREAMTELQRRIAIKGNIVAEGRDMGTVVFPRADYKFFLNASSEVRAERRYKERLERGESISRTDVEKELKKRDNQDMTREIAPLRPAEDAVLVDTTEKNIDEVVNEIISITG